LSWDRKKRGRGLYFYRSVREGGQARKQYVGRGREAEDLAREVEERRAARLAEQAARNAEQARVAAAERPLRELRNMVHLLVRVVLEAAGYHLHRGQWRRRRYDSDRNTDRGGTHPEDRRRSATVTKERLARTAKHGRPTAPAGSPGSVAAAGAT
jgi:hypothetical protein